MGCGGLVVAFPSRDARRRAVVRVEGAAIRSADDWVSSRARSAKRARRSSSDPAVCFPDSVGLQSNTEGASEECRPSALGANAERRHRAPDLWHVSCALNFCYRW